jgi:hypothetical protein
VFAFGNVWSCPKPCQYECCHYTCHFTHKTKSPWPLHFKFPHWWRRQSRSKFASHYSRGTNGVFLHVIKWIMFHGHLDYFQKPPLGGRPNTKTRRPHHSERSQPLIYSILSCMKIHMNRKFIKIAFGWGPGHIWLHTTQESPWSHYMVLEVVLGRPSDTFFWALTISWSRLLAHVWSGPPKALQQIWCRLPYSHKEKTNSRKHLKKYKHIHMFHITAREVFGHT